MSLMERLEQIFNPQDLVVRVAQFGIDLVAALLAFLAFYVVWRILRRTAAAVLRRSRMDETAAAFIQTLFKYAILTLGVVAALGEVGINTASLLTSLGVAGLTIGFAARDALSNIISGIFIFWDRPFVIGDLVEIDGKYGRVELITMRSTRVVTPDGKMLAIPNTTIVNSTVVSYTNFPHLRLDIGVTVGVGENLKRVRETILDIVTQHPACMDKPVPVVVVSKLNDYNVELELRVWIMDEKKHILLRLELCERIFESLRSAKIDMPHETLQLAPFEVSLQDTANPPRGGA